MEPVDEEFRFPDSHCFGCSSTNPVGLNLRFFRRGDEVYTRYTAPEHLCGPPGVIHGGIVATIIDEVCSAAVVALKGSHVVTGELTVRYERPSPINEELEVRARVVEERPRYFVVQCEVRKGQDVLARSTGKFFPKNTG